MHQKLLCPILSNPIEPKPPQAVDIRTVMRHFASHVTVATGALDSGELFGLTVTAFTSVSLEPPVVLICIRDESTAKDLFTQAKRFCVNVLQESQQPIAERFSLTGEAKRFENLDYYIGKGGSPVIQGSLGFIDCKITRVLHEGDHTIFFGEAVDVHGEEMQPLLYLNRKYVKLEN